MCGAESKFDHKLQEGEKGNGCCGCDLVQMLQLLGSRFSGEVGELLLQFGLIFKTGLGNMTSHPRYQQILTPISPKAWTEIALHSPHFLNTGSSGLCCKNLLEIKIRSCRSPALHCQYQ